MTRRLVPVMLLAVPKQHMTQLELWRDMARSVEAIRHVSPADAERWPEFCDRMARLAGPV